MIILNKKFSKSSLVVVLVVVFALGLAGLIMAATTVDLGTADSFAVLAGSGIVVSNPSTVTGDIGSFPTTTIGSGITILSPGVDHGGDASTQSAKLALVTAYTNASQTPVTTVTANTTDSFAGIGTGTGGYTLAPGIYQSGSSMGIPASPNVLVLDGGGDSNAVFIFRAGSTLNTGAGSVVSLTNGTQACNVFWQVGSSATFGTTSNFKGNVLAVASITDAGGSTITGRLLADADNDGTGAVTLDNSTVTKATCAAAAGGSSSGGGHQSVVLLKTLRLMLSK